MYNLVKVQKTNKKKNPVYLRPGNVHLKQVLKMIFRPLRFENCSVSFVITLSPEILKNLKSVLEKKKGGGQKADNQSMESNHSVNNYLAAACYVAGSMLGPVN